MVCVFLTTNHQSSLPQHPKKRISKWSKPWWNQNISDLRKIFHSCARFHRKNNTSSSPELKKIKNNYFAAIAKAKKAHWNTFLANATPNDIWAAKRIKTSSRLDLLPSFPDAENASQVASSLISHFFPPKPIARLVSPSPHDDAVDITQDEVSTALKASSNSSAPGPDSIPYGIWKTIHRKFPDIIPALLSPLFKFGYHPLILKSANGVVLPKPNKPDYNSPASFRVIVLLQTISKIIERIAAVRLANIARSNNLIHINQCGSLSGISAADAVTALLHDVQTFQAADLKASTLFLDIKDGFDNVDASILQDRLSSHNTPNYLHNWITSFVQQRKCTLLFKGSPNTPVSVSVGVPQGSPISPLLFVIYVAPLHLPHPTNITLSYVDDFAITTASSSTRKNIRVLQKAAQDIQLAGATIKVGFSVPKTELMHWSTPRDRLPNTPNANFVENGNIFATKETVRWLGFWLSSTSNTNNHFNKRLLAAAKVFGIAKSLSPPGGGLSSHNARRLAQSLILPILSYGAAVLTPSKTIMEKMNVFWNSVLRWVLNCFRSTNIAALTREAALPPLQVYATYLRRRHALRICSSSPSLNPASIRLPPSFPSVGLAPLGLRKLLVGLGQRAPKPWISIATTRPRSILIDNMIISILEFLPNNLHPSFKAVPSNPPSQSIKQG